MGLFSCGVGDPVDKKISKSSAREFIEKKSVIKMLLLGPGESGKTSIQKQMNEAYGTPLKKEEMATWKHVIHSNIVDAMQILCAAVDMFGFMEDLKHEEEFRQILSAERMTDLSSRVEGKTYGLVIKTLWDDPAIQKAWSLRSQLHIMESHEVFLNNIDHYSSPTFEPTINDVVLARVRTSGILCRELKIEGKFFELYDVGGQRNERKKWIHVFDNVHAVIFVNALSEYDQVCFEDGTTNRMQESLTLFKSMAEHDLFKTTGFILFLNKIDILRKKLGPHPINEVSEFSDYTGGDDFDKATQYFIKKFQDVSDAAYPNRKLYIHLMCAADASNVKKVFDDCRTVLMDNAIKSSGSV
eukprot:c21369_g2_i2.p1 GENE.c21369_g2_i2~~c21369_g2_i2.p1  ORF type:complete len:356 (+),score=136.63 c21369_g2_i2:48-1115(+)